MGVIGCTTYRFTWIALRGPLLLGVLLVVAMFIVLAAPCERGLCDRPERTSPSALQLPLSDGAPISAPDTSAHCALHCGLLLLPPLMIVVTPALAARISLAVSVGPMRLIAPLLLPPPQIR